MVHPTDSRSGGPADLPQRARRHRAVLLALTLVLVAAPLILGTLRLLGIL